MSPEISTESLLRQTLRATAFMMVPVIAFLAILSAVALFAVPKPVMKEADMATDHALPSSEPQSAPPHATPGARAAIKPNKI